MSVEQDRETSVNNRQVILISRPTGVAQAENFAIREAPVEPLAAGQVLVRNEFISVYVGRGKLPELTASLLQLQSAVCRSKTCRRSQRFKCSLAIISDLLT